MDVWTGHFLARSLVKAPGVLGSVLSSFQACFCEHGQTSDINNFIYSRTDMAD